MPLFDTKSSEPRPPLSVAKPSGTSPAEVKAGATAPNRGEAHVNLTHDGAPCIIATGPPVGTSEHSLSGSTPRKNQACTLATSPTNWCANVLPSGAHTSPHSSASNCRSEAGVSAASLARLNALNCTSYVCRYPGRSSGCDRDYAAANGIASQRGLLARSLQPLPSLACARPAGVSAGNNGGALVEASTPPIHHHQPPAPLPARATKSHPQQASSDALRSARIPALASASLNEMSHTAPEVAHASASPPGPYAHLSTPAEVNLFKAIPDDVKNYLKEEHVPQLFNAMSTDLLRSQPADPVGHMLNWLKSRRRQLVVAGEE